ncbi:MAG: DUF262 domain-containing protein [Clostridia bacterium]|nr:DUF262 domain-containing protein [Clostridia bacterium]
MSYYNIEQWTIRDVANAFKNANGDSSNRKVVVPIFQRGLRWEDSRREQFIDSLYQGYPFGSLLFAKQEDPNTYSVVDGLQRSSTVCDYVFNPLSKNNVGKIDDEVLSEIRLALFPDNMNITINEKIENIILTYYHEKRTFDSIENFELAVRIMSEIPSNCDPMLCAQKITNALRPFMQKQKSIYEKICSSNVPIVVYSGPKDLLNEIFNRINVKGIPLNPYEIYAAVWSQSRKPVNTPEIVQKVVDKYLTLTSAGYDVDEFDANQLLTSKELTAFEYLFGLGKYWAKRFECLRITKDEKNDTVNEIGFEIIDACINDSKNLPNLDKDLFKYNINKLQKRIEEAIFYVQESIATISEFKGNKRAYKALHSKYQIISLISFTFKQMYDLGNLDTKKASWKLLENTLRAKLRAHYVADIISNEWHDGGGGKVFTANRENKYLEDLSRNRWESLLDNYYQSQLAEKQAERFSNPTNADSVILNCIYINIFSANDQLSTKKFDIEHLATKEKMRKLMKPFIYLRLPVSCIANLCYLPEDINRGKGEKTIYEVHNMSMPIDVIENKFSFTSSTDFDWMFIEYSNANELQNNYLAFINNRYKIIKKMFLKSLGHND